MTDNPDVLLDRIQRHMELSQTLGAPIEQIPKKTLAVVKLLTPWLYKNTTPREAAIVLATTFAYFATILTVDTKGDKERATDNMHNLLDAAITIMHDLIDNDEP